MWLLWCPLIQVVFLFFFGFGPLCFRKRKRWICPKTSLDLTVVLQRYQTEWVFMCLDSVGAFLLDMSLITVFNRTLNFMRITRNKTIMGWTFRMERYNYSKWGKLMDLALLLYECLLMLLSFEGAKKKMNLFMSISVNQWKKLVCLCSLAFVLTTYVL